MNEFKAVLVLIYATCLAGVVLPGGEPLTLCEAVVVLCNVLRLLAKWDSTLNVSIVSHTCHHVFARGFVEGMSLK